MKCIFVYTETDVIKGELAWARPVGLECIISYLNSIGNKCMELFYTQKEINWASIASADILGVSINYENIEKSLKVIEHAKMINPRLKVVVGGPYPTVMDKELIANVKYIDVVARGEGELIFEELLKYKFNDLNKIKGISYRDETGVYQKNEDRELLENLDSIPLSYRELRNISSEVITVHTSRGCPYSCNFCVCTNGQRWRTFSIETVLNHIDNVFKNCDSHAIRFVDANFFVDANRALLICESLKNKFQDIEIFFDARADLIVKNKNLMKRFAKNGVQTIEVGLESGSDSILNQLGKGITKEVNKKCISILRDVGIGITPCYIMWTPWITESELKESYDFLLEQELYIPQRLFCRLIPYPGTEIHKKMKNEGLLVKDGWRYTYNFVDYSIRMKWNAMISLYDTAYKCIHETQNWIFDQLNKYKSNRYIAEYIRGEMWLFQREVLKAFGLIFDYINNSDLLHDLCNKIVINTYTLSENKMKKIKSAIDLYQL